jgi:hypothetical protein
MAALEKKLEDLIAPTRARRTPRRAVAEDRPLVSSRGIAATLAVAFAAMSLARAEDFREFNSKGLPRSQGIVMRVSHPSQWRMVPVGDDMALAELRGPHGSVTGILQIARGRQRNDMATLCKAERARSMLSNLTGGEQDTRVTDVRASQRQGRPAYEIRYERNNAPAFMVVRSVVVCLKDSQLLVSCAGAGQRKAALTSIEPVCSRVLDSLAITEE